MAAANNDEKVKIGTITAIHGRRGKLKANYNIDKEIFKEIILSHKASLINNKPFEGQHISFAKQCSIISMGNNINNLSDLVGQGIFANRSVFGNDILIMDIEGLNVMQSSIFRLQPYGIVKEVLNFGGGMLVEIIPNTATLNTTNSKAQKAKTEIYLFNDKIFPVINIEKGYIVLNKKAAIGAADGIAH